MMSKTALLKAIKQEVLELKESPLYSYRQSNNYMPVIGEGSHDAQIMFIGEAPGKNEAITGKPFCGAAGRILDELLDSIDLQRNNVYVTNIVKDRPPDNRDPTNKEIECYTPFLTRQIEIIQPRVIATLGRFSMTFILTKFNVPEKDDTISRNHGKLIRAQASYGDIDLLPLYHPAVALYNGSRKQTLLQDFQVLAKSSL